MRTSRAWIACIGCVAVIGMATGCRLSGVFQGQKASAPQPMTTASRLTGSQVSEIQVSLCRTLEQQGQLDRAREGYRKILESDAKNATAAWRLAVVHDRLGEVDKSEAFYRQALEIEPKNVELLADYGYSLYLKRRWAEAERILGEARKLEPKNTRVQNNLGLLLAQTDRSEDALAAFRRGGCQEAEAQSNLGLVLAMNGRDEPASKAFEKSLAIQGNGKAAKQGLTALRSKAQRGHTAPPTEAIEATQDNVVVPVSHEQPAGSEFRSDASLTSKRSGKSRIEATHIRRNSPSR
jgi:Tfp pilus assembly protein PilF